MSKKAQRGEDKHSGQRRKKGKQRGFPITTAQQTTAQSKPASAVSTPPAKALTRESKLTLIQHKHIANELRRIAILAGIMLFVLVVLALAIP